jgi:ABC-type Fe3+ transport system substrate-binding protein
MEPGTGEQVLAEQKRQKRRQAWLKWRQSEKGQAYFAKKKKLPTP